MPTNKPTHTPVPELLADAGWREADAMKAERDRLREVNAGTVETLIRAEAGAVCALAELDAAADCVKTESVREGIKEVRAFLVSVRDEARAALRAEGK